MNRLVSALILVLLFVNVQIYAQYQDQFDSLGSSVKSLKINNKTIHYIDDGKELEVAGLESEIKKLNTTSPETIISHATKILTEKGFKLRDDITALGIKL